MRDFAATIQPKPSPGQPLQTALKGPIRVLVGTIALASFSIPAALAQQTVYIGGGYGPNVEVNLDVLEPGAGFDAQGLLPPPSRPPVSRLRVDGESGTPRLTLTPPSGAARMETAAAAPRLAPPRLAQPAAPAAAARRSAPPPRPATARPAPLPSGASSAPPPPPQVAATPPPPAPAPRAPAPRTTAAAPAPEPAPQATPAPPAPAREQVAQLPAAGAALESGRALRIRFAANASKLPDSARADLKSLAGQLESDPGTRLQLLAYASGSAETASRARRTSLARALAVRSFLIDEGVRSTRIDVRALGTKAAGGPADRVDVNIVKR